MKNFFSFLSRSSPKKILCLDGGGVRTIAALVFLKKLESESGKKVSDMFDMFIGTSAGSLNAACFAYGDFSAEKVKTYWSKINFYKHKNLSSLTIRQSSQEEEIAPFLHSDLKEKLYHKIKNYLALK